MHTMSPRTLTWLTLATALCSAILLTQGEDAGLPDIKGMGLPGSSAPGTASASQRHPAPVLHRGLREVDPRRREH